MRDKVTKESRTLSDLKSCRKNDPSDGQPVLLHQYFLQSARSNPNACAIQSVDRQWSYQELSQHCQTYAEILHACGLVTGDRIVLELHPCPQAIALIAACSMLGLVFVPVSPDSPPARVQQILTTTEACLHVRAVPPTASWAPLQGRLEGDSLKIEGTLSRTSVKSAVLETDLAYIIFTSGSTGRPKGIMMTHRAVLAFFRGMVSACGLEPAARVGTIAPLQFDFSLLDMGLALGCGATLVQVPRNLALMPKRLVQYLQQQHITQMHAVPSLWRMLLRHGEAQVAQLQHLKRILFAGEPFPIADLVRLQSLLPHLKIINCFGQSESIAASFTAVPNPLPADTENLSIGFAYPGAEMLLLDDRRQVIQQPRQVGEIYLRGATLFSGYWRDADATATALVPHPLRPDNGEKVFRTGDLAYQGTEGELYFARRRDWQVKILGNRVELEEVERRLISHPQVVQAAAVAIHQQGELTLVASIVPGENPPTSQELRQFCGETLPKYAIPAEIRVWETLPITLNGKVDRQALQQMWISNH